MTVIIKDFVKKIKDLKNDNTQMTKKQKKHAKFLILQRVINAHPNKGVNHCHSIGVGYLLHSCNSCVCVNFFFKFTPISYFVPFSYSRLKSAFIDYSMFVTHG